MKTKVLPSGHREVALTVLELEDDLHYWIVMEAAEDVGDEVLSFRPLDSSPRGYKTYAQAAAHGAAAMQILRHSRQSMRPCRETARAGVSETVLPAARREYRADCA